jgi:hypothetical protein
VSDIVKEQLDRIENGIRFLVKAVGFPMRNAWDGKSWEEAAPLREQEEKRNDEAVERIMRTGDPYAKEPS